MWCGWGVIELREVSWLVGVVELLFSANEVFSLFLFLFLVFFLPCKILKFTQCML